MASANLITATVTVSDVFIFVVFIVIPGVFLWWLVQKTAPKNTPRNPLDNSHNYTGLDDDDFY